MLHAWQQAIFFLTSVSSSINWRDWTDWLPGPFRISCCSALVLALRRDKCFCRNEINMFQLSVSCGELVKVALHWGSSLPFFWPHWPGGYPTAQSKSLIKNRFSKFDNGNILCSLPDEEEKLEPSVVRTSAMTRRSSWVIWDVIIWFVEFFAMHAESVAI